MAKNIRVGIVGAGLIGAKRAEAIRRTKAGKLIAIADVDHARAKVLAAKYGVESAGAWRKVFLREDFGAIILGGAKTIIAPLALFSRCAGKKPFSRKTLRGSYIRRKQRI